MYKNAHNSTINNKFQNRNNLASNSSMYQQTVVYIERLYSNKNEQNYNDR